jgi:hypothetical protein
MEDTDELKRIVAGSAKSAHTRSLVAVGATLTYEAPVHTVRLLHTRSEVDVGGDSSNGVPSSLARDVDAVLLVAAPSSHGAEMFLHDA